MWPRAKLSLNFNDINCQVVESIVYNTGNVFKINSDVIELIERQWIDEKLIISVFYCFLRNVQIYISFFPRCYILTS